MTVRVGFVLAIAALGLLVAMVAGNVE